MQNPKKPTGANSTLNSDQFSGLELGGNEVGDSSLLHLLLQYQEIRGRLYEAGFKNASLSEISQVWRDHRTLWADLQAAEDSNDIYAVQSMELLAKCRDEQLREAIQRNKDAGE